ncbi:hypothetical protein ACEN2I_11315 [Flavobacterium sp. W22_SRS_FK3]|uniref:hypothetical protein n=1 Tax=Flavobacterium sp. W22_SRS_FK3 TaxID=3240275 RepID=UPI003F931CC3
MINCISGKPYFFLGILIPIFLLLGYLNSDEILDINIHDTYFIIKYPHLGILLSLLYGFPALLYFVFMKLNFRFIKWMTVIHIVVSIAGILLICFLKQLIRKSDFGDLNSILTDMYFNQKIMGSIVLLFLSIVAVQIFFFINFFYALIKGRVRH